MANFDSAVAVVLGHEGGFFHNLKTGEVVNMGITHWLLRDLGILPKAPHSQPASDYEINFVKTLTTEQAKDIYYQVFWDKLHLKSFTSQDVATKEFDLAVNTGSVQAVKFLQRAVNELSSTELVVDGALGPKTLAAANSVMPDELLGKRATATTPGCGIRGEAEVFYRHLASSDPSHAADLPGWLARLDT